MAYTPNNPYIPGDPYSYDLKWIITQLKTIDSNMLTSEQVEKIAQSIIAAKQLNLVNVKDYGALGNGSNDDIEAIEKAYNIAREMNACLYFPDGSYYISRTLDMPEAVDLTMEGNIYYIGAGTAVRSGSAATSTDGVIQNWKIHGLNPLNTGSVGLELVNYNGCFIDINICSNFETGIIFHGNTKGFNNNIIRFGLCSYNQKHVVLYSTGSGWCNENLFIGGRFGTSSSAGYQATAITIDSASGYYNNANVFLKPNVERSATGIDIKYGSNNDFENVRMEAVTDPVIISNDSVNNHINIAFGTVADYIPLNDITYSNMDSEMVSEGNGIIIGDIASTYASTSLQASCTDIYTMNAGQIVEASSQMLGASITAERSLSVPANRRFGPVIKMPYPDPDKTTVHVEPLIGTGGSDPRLFVVFFDASGSIINTAPTAYSFTAPVPITLDGATGFYFGNRSKFTFAPPAGTAYFYCAIYCNSANVITGIKITANRPVSIWHHHSCTPAIPTSPGILNQIVRDSTGTTNGWRWGGSAWTAL